MRCRRDGKYTARFACVVIGSKLRSHDQANSNRTNKERKNKYYAPTTVWLVLASTRVTCYLFHRERTTNMNHFSTVCDHYDSIASECPNTTTLHRSVRPQRQYYIRVSDHNDNITSECTTTTTILHQSVRPLRQYYIRVSKQYNIASECPNTTTLHQSVGPPRQHCNSEITEITIQFRN